MNALDYAVVLAYLVGLLMFGYWLRHQSTEEEYFLGGRTMGWFPLALSTMATQLSAISFVSAPAFVGMREGGGLMWLTYEFALPLAMILVMFVITPALYRAGIVSIYEFLDQRYGRPTRILISVSFQVVRSFSTGIMVYAMSLILEAVLGIELWQSVLAVGVITLLYSTSGGMKAVVYGDALQMILIFGGLLTVAIYAIAEIGGLGNFWQQVDPERLVAVDYFSLGLDGDEFGFLPMLFGGFVLYASYYGCDQTQAQRILSARDQKDARKLLFANGLLRFPLVLLYCFVGLIVGVAVVNDPGLAARIPADKPDYMMPIFIIEHLPHGIIGLLLVAILAAAMSSLSSAVNSLAAVTLEDLEAIGANPRSEGQQVLWARGVSLFWGIAILIMSLFAGSIAPTVIEAINKVGSALYGPILGVFLMGMLGRRVTGAGASIGLVVGVVFNLYLWKAQPQVFWMWWNFIGLALTTVVAYAVSALSKLPAAEPVADGEGISLSAIVRSPLSIVLVSVFFVIVIISTFLKDLQPWITG
ncbi:MAG: sodium/solute symporter [Xanthomonadales bacterium]|nr:sodium/solute symporter [Xanthomonadales bacterium]